MASWPPSNLRKSDGITAAEITHSLFRSGSQDEVHGYARLFTGAGFGAPCPFANRYFSNVSGSPCVSGVVTVAPISGEHSSNQLRGGGRPHKLVLPGFTS